MTVLRMLAVGTWVHVKQMSRSPFDIATSILIPLVQATLAVYLFRASPQPQALLGAAVGAGMMGIWSSVLFGSGGAIQRQRWQGTLEMLMLAPRRPALVILPFTIATAVTGTYAMFATVLWGRLLYGIRLDFADPPGFIVAVPVCILSLGMFGLLLASTFVLLPNANALANTMEYPIWLLSGMLIPITALPGWTGPLAAALPTTWGSRAVRAAATGGSVWPPLGICLGISLVCLGIGAVTLSYVERRARVTATLALN